MAEGAEDAKDQAGRPAFARGYPRDAALDALVAAFEAGDFARVQRDGARVIAAAGDDAVKRAAEELVARTKPDPLAVAFVAMTAVLLVVLSVWWVLHDGPG